MALNNLYCADVPLSNYSLAHSLGSSFSVVNSVLLFEDGQADLLRP